MPEAAATRGVLCKIVLLEISQNSQENTCARVSFLIKFQVWGPHYYLKSVFSELIESNLMKNIPLIKKKFFLFLLVITIPSNFKKCCRTNIFTCKRRVKSNFINVNLHILLFSFISNYDDGHNRIIQSLKPTRISVIMSMNIHEYACSKSAMKHKRNMFKVNNKDTRTTSLTTFRCLYC